MRRIAAATTTGSVLPWHRYQLTDTIEWIHMHDCYTAAM
jgi:hypothetical protein